MPSPLPSSPIRVALVDDYEIVVQGLARMFDQYGDRIRVVELNSGTSVDSLVDIALYETFAMPSADQSDIEDLVNNPRLDKVVAYTWTIDKAVIARTLARGVRGYLSKSLTAAELVSALEAIHAGQIVVSPNPRRAATIGGDWPGRVEGLTNREAEVVALITQGFRNTEIAQRTFLPINSVKSYIRTAYRKMGVADRSQAIEWGRRHGFTPDRRRIRP